LCKRILVCSSKNWTNKTQIKKVITHDNVVIHRESENIFENLGFKTEILPDDTDGYEYLKQGNFDKVIAFCKNDSRGTEIIIENAKELGIDIEVVRG